MPLIPSSKNRSLRSVTLALDETARRRLRNYARYSGATPDEIVEGALTRLFDHDQDFTPWEKENGEPQQPPKRRRAKTTPQTVASSALRPRV